MMRVLFVPRCAAPARGFVSQPGTLRSPLPFRRSRRRCSGTVHSVRQQRLQGDVEGSRQVQLQATELLKQLLEASDVNAVAEQHSDSMTEEFFMVVSTYIEMAKKDGEEAVVKQLEGALRAAMAAKNATLRPEIQLLNELLGCEDDSRKRRQLLNREAAGTTLAADDGYFFRLLQQVTDDVMRQPDNPRKASLQAWLADIKVAAEARAGLS